MCNLCKGSQKEARGHLCLFYFPFDLGDLEGVIGFPPRSLTEDSSTLQKCSKANGKRRGFWLQTESASWHMVLEMLLQQLLLDLTFPSQPDTATLYL